MELKAYVLVVLVISQSTHPARSASRRTAPLSPASPEKPHPVPLQRRGGKNQLILVACKAKSSPLEKI
jgi:hypothetical protein